MISKNTFTYSNLVEEVGHVFLCLFNILENSL